MPICDGTNINMSTLNTGAADTDPHGDGAKLKKSRDQAYFNSYDFDAIEELPSEEEEVVKLDSRHSIRRIDLNEGTRNREITPVSDVYFKRLTSYFTTTNRIPDQIKVHESQSGSDANSFSSSDSSKAIFAEGTQEHLNITETPKNTINNFLLPRAILKSQSGITARSMSVRSLSSIASSKTATSSIRSTRSINIKNVNVTICNGSNGSNDKINMKSIGGQVEIHKQMIGNSGNTKEDSGKVVTPTTAPDVLDTNNSGFAMQCYGKNDRERVISQSHYSTEKSGSSGYYSSNLCSTSSIEDHIYSEPVIDVMHSRILPLTKTLPQGLVGKLHDNDSSVHRVNMSCEANLKTIENDDKLKTELRTLETSIENLDRHLKSYPKLLGHQFRPAMTYLPCGEGDCVSQTIPGGFQPRGRQQLPTIMEGIDNQSPPKTQNTWSDDMDDSLMDIDLDSFLLVNELNKVTERTEPLSGIDNPKYRKRPQINDETLENNYKCSKYVNSCPEDAYKVESVIEGDETENQEKPIAFYLKKYNDKIHFQNTKDMLEEIRSKIRDLVLTAGSSTEGDILPSELEANIATLKMELETYLRIMNRNSEMEIKQLCTGLVNNQKLVAMTKAFERRKSFDKNSDIEYELTYEPVQNHNGVLDYAKMNSGIRSIRCSDPNFKMRRKSLNDIFPEISDGFESTASSSNTTFGSSSDDQPPGNQCVTGMYSSPVVHCNAPQMSSSTRLKRNLSFQRPTLNPDPHVKISTHPTEDDEDKNTFLEWHKNKPSIWEQYYGTNRINQTLVGKRGQLIKNQASMLSYPSSRPESDFTLDLPRAEQLRLKMEKEKKFRNRCRILTTFLSLVFFLLTVMVVSLVLTRGKRMFGSML